MRGARGGFSLLDLLVSLTVIAVLIAILTPALSGAFETANRVRCQSNLSQVGLALQLYADDNKGVLPESIVTERPRGSRGGGSASSIGAQDTLFLRFADEVSPGMSASTVEGWDGLGELARPDGALYLSTPSVLYCPSHEGEHPLDRYADAWAGAASGAIAGNFQYRLPRHSALDMLDKGTTLVSDGLRTRSDFNHVVGANMLKADMSVAWYDDDGGEVYGSLTERGDVPGAEEAVLGAWSVLDASGPRRTEGAGGSHSGDPSPHDPSHVLSIDGVSTRR